MTTNKTRTDFRNRQTWQPNKYRLIIGKSLGCLLRHTKQLLYSARSMVATASSHKQTTTITTPSVFVSRADTNNMCLFDYLNTSTEFDPRFNYVQGFRYDDDHTALFTLFNAHQLRRAAIKYNVARLNYYCLDSSAVRGKTSVKIFRLSRQRLKLLTSAGLLINLRRHSW